MRRCRFFMLLGLFFSFASCFPIAAEELFRDDFSRFPPRVFSSPVKELTNALHEYHYVAHRGVPMEPWASAMIHEDVWAGGDEDGKPYVEMHVVNALARHFSPMLITGDSEWSDYTVEAKVRPLLLKERAGLVFRYHTNRHHYLFALEGGQRVRLALRLPFEKKMRDGEWRELGSVPFPYDPTRYYTLKVENRGARIRAFVDGRLLLEAEDSEILKGKAGIAADIPARFADFVVTVTPEIGTSIRARMTRRDNELNQLRAENPKPKLWKKFAISNFGAGRNVRFGDLDGNGELDLLIGQNIRKASRNSFSQITCLTAVTFDGRVLWQLGRPDPYNDVLANDTPFQIYDLDGDGKNEVILAKDFKLQVLEGATGKLKSSTWMPKAPADNDERPYEFEVGDSIYFVNLDGGARPAHVLVKDRYRTFWIFDKNLKEIWSGQGNIGHYPYSLDVDGDRREEILIGYALWSPDGKKIWDHDKTFKQHSDAVTIGNFSGDSKAPLRAYSAASDEGFIVFDLQGRILKRQQIGHTQSPVVGKFRPDLPGLQILTVNFWRNPGIVAVYDPEGSLLAMDEPIHSGSPMLPVNWRGDGQEFVMLSGNIREGGMIDGWLRRVVMFPNDGHPDLACAVLDLTGDPRDEVVLWDQKGVWVYTQDRPFHGAKIYAPRRNPDYNESNYRWAVSMPEWK